MKHLNFLKLTLLALLISNSGLGQTLTEFETSLKECGMSANIPTGFVESKIIDNNEMGYEYAIKYPDKDFEVRYAIRPITYKVYANDSVKQAMETKKQFRNTSYGGILKSVILRITGDVDYEYKELDKTAAKDEFNADWGAITLVETKSVFGKGFKYCMIVSIHKDNVADAYFFYMAKTKENIPQNIRPLFHSLRFD